MRTEHDNLIEYQDPIMYDLENRNFEPVGPMYLTLAQQFGGPALDIGCGTGRYTIPLAQAGIEMTGLDITPQMLDRAKQKAQDVTINWVEADARSFQVDRTFRFIFESGSTFQHLLDRAGQEAMLACVRDHLTADGRFLVSVLFPHPPLLQNVDDEQPWFSYQNDAGQEVQVSGIDHYDPLRQVRTETAYRRWRDADDQEIVKVAPLSLRYTFPQEMELLLTYTGFAIEERYGSVDFASLTGESRYMIYLCRKVSSPEISLQKKH